MTLTFRVNPKPESVGPPVRTPSPSDRSRVAVAACPSYSPGDVQKALQEILQAIGGLSSVIKPGQTVLVKPNLFGDHPPDHAVTTHPELVRQVVLACFDAGAVRVWVGDSPVAITPDERLWTGTGMTAALAGTAADLKSWQVKQSPVKCGDDVLTLPEWFAKVDVVVSLPKLKTHSLTTLTCGLKNVYGMVSGPAKSRFHVKYTSPLTMSGFLVNVFSLIKPQLTIADAVVAMEGNGPAHGQPLPVGVLLGSRDAVALDSVACTALSIQPSSVPMIQMAAAASLGRMNRDEIEAVGSGVSRLQSVSLKPSMARYLSRIPEPLFKLAPRLFRMRPRIKNRFCSKCGACAGICPKKAIQEDGRSGFPAINRSACFDCFCCVESCPNGAIAVQLYLAGFICLSRQRRGKTQK